MAVLQMNLSGYEAQTGVFEPLPAGNYIVQITDSEVRESKAGNPMVKWEFTVVDGDFSGRKVWDNMTLNNEVSLKRLKSLAVAGGHPNPDYINDTEEMHGLFVKIRVKVEQQDGYGPQNNVSSFGPAEVTQGHAPAAMHSPKPTPAVAPAPSPAKKPWQK